MLAFASTVTADLRGVVDSGELGYSRVTGSIIPVSGQSLMDRDGPVISQYDVADGGVVLAELRVGVIECP